MSQDIPVTTLLFIGPAAAGKSALLERFARDTFSTAQYQPTIVVDLLIKHERLLSAQRRLLLWDTSGQERFASIRRNYYSAAQGVAIVFDLRHANSFAEASVRFVAEMQLHLPESVPFIFIGTHADEASSQASRVVADIARRHAADTGAEAYFEVSSATGDGVHAAIMSLAAAATSRAASGGECSRRRTNKRRRSFFGCARGERAPDETELPTYTSLGDAML